MRSSVSDRCQLWLFLLVCLLSAVGCAADKTEVADSDSNSNWLKSCDETADCGGGYACVRGLCFADCSSNDACDAPASACEQLGASDICGQSSEHTSQCVASCSSDADCTSVSSLLSCQSGVCLPKQSCDEPGDDDTNSSAEDGGAASATGDDAGVDAQGQAEDASTGNVGDDAGAEPAEVTDAGAMSTDAAVVPPLVDAAVGQRSYTGQMTGGIGCCDIYSVIMADPVADYCVLMTVYFTVGDVAEVRAAMAAAPADVCQLSPVPQPQDGLVAESIQSLGTAGFDAQAQFVMTLDATLTFPAGQGVPSSVDVSFADLPMDAEWH